MSEAVRCARIGEKMAEEKGSDKSVNQAEGVRMRRLDQFGSAEKAKRKIGGAAVVGIVLVALFLISAFSAGTLSARAQTTAQSGIVGVSVGNWFKYDYSMTETTKNGIFSDVGQRVINVTGVSGTTLTLNISLWDTVETIASYKSIIYSDDLSFTGGILYPFSETHSVDIIQAGLNAKNYHYDSIYHANIETLPMTYLFGMQRDTIHMHFELVAVKSTVDVYWDKATGALVELKMSGIFGSTFQQQELPIEEHWIITDTNAWGVYLTFNIYKAGVIGDAAGILRMFKGTTLVGEWRAGSGDNNPADQSQGYPPNYGGPIPSGTWWVYSPGVNSKHPDWYYLKPNQTTNTRGRDWSVPSGFYIHGTDIAPAFGTHGCIAIEAGRFFSSFDVAMKKYNPSGNPIKLVVSYYYYWYLKIVRITAHSPVNILVTSLDGSRVGYDWTTNTTVNEIEGANYTGPGTEPQVISIPSLFPDNYTVNAYGTGTGSYTIMVDSIAENDSITGTTTWTGRTSPGRLDENTVQLDEKGNVVPGNGVPEFPTSYLDRINAFLSQITQPIGNLINATLGAYIPSSVTSFLFADQPVILVATVLAIIIAIAAVGVKRRKRRV